MSEETLRIGDTVLMPARIRRTWRDADASRRAGDDGRRADLELPRGRMVYGVPVSDLASAVRD
jgi:hypothetical protein